jgi:hypothetical protein
MQNILHWRLFEYKIEILIEAVEVQIFCICGSHIQNIFDLCACADSNPEIPDGACAD